MNGGTHPAMQSPHLNKTGLIHLVALLLLAAFPLCAKQPDPAPYTIRVYTNLMEVPALVLGLNSRQLQRIDASSFAIRLDAGPKFSPSYIRLEGDDPISLAIVLDLSDTSKDLLPALRDAIPALAPTGLHPKDHFTLYGLDCALVSSTEDLAATPANLSASVNAALANTDLHGPKKKLSACADSVKLWDSLGYIAKRLATRPGRRIMLVVGDGFDGGSIVTSPELRAFTATKSITVFGMTSTSGSFFCLQQFDNLRELCQLTGGVVLPAYDAHDITKTLPRFIDLARNRYILEFHRPADATAGMHRVQVTLPKFSATIHVGGTTVPLLTTEELSVPEVLPSKNDAEPAPDPPQ